MKGQSPGLIIVIAAIIFLITALVVITIFGDHIFQPTWHEEWECVRWELDKTIFYYNDGTPDAIFDAYKHVGCHGGTVSACCNWIMEKNNTYLDERDDMIGCKITTICIKQQKVRVWE